MSRCSSPLITQGQEVSMNIDATKQNILIQLEQNLSQLYLFSSAKQGNVSSEENQRNPN